MYLNKISEIKNYLFNQMQKGDYIAWCLYSLAYEEKVSKISEIRDWNKMEIFLSTHPGPKDIESIEYYNPQVLYYAEVLGAYEHINSHNGHP